MNDDKVSQIVLENLLARIVIDPETGLGDLSGALTPMEIESLVRAKAIFVEREASQLQSVKLSDL